MNQMYTPAPLDTRDIELPKELDELIEEMARNVHDVWAQGRIAEGWTYGEQRDDKRKTHPCLVPYEELPDAERDREASERADKLLGKMERQGLNDSLLYSEAMRLFGMSQYRMKDYALADGALRFAYETRNAQGKGGDAVGIGILQVLSEIAILRGQPVEATSLLTLISQIIENNRTTLV